MKDLKFASHNSFTYLPVKWYMKPFNFMSRCQSKTIKEQYEEYGVRIFDLRVAFDKNGEAHVKHGFMDYGVVDYNTLEWLNSQEEPVYVRLLLEKHNCSKRQEIMFTLYCSHMENTYPNIRFTEGRRKYDWAQLYAFKHTVPSMDADFSSVKGGKLNDLWPWYYAKKHNSNAIAVCERPYLMLDFVEIR